MAAKVAVQRQTTEPSGRSDISQYLSERQDVSSVNLSDHVSAILAIETIKILRQRN